MASFDPVQRSTFYTITVSDPTGGGLQFSWTNTNQCGEFKAGNSPTVEWHHPDVPGGCPPEPIHPGTITVVVTGSGGAISCRYVGGSAPGDKVLCQEVKK